MSGKEDVSLCLALSTLRMVIRLSANTRRYANHYLNAVLAHGPLSYIIVDSLISRRKKPLGIILCMLLLNQVQNTTLSQRPFSKTIQAKFHAPCLIVQPLLELFGAEEFGDNGIAVKYAPV